jgi:hypothetical protein
MQLRDAWQPAAVEGASVPYCGNCGAVLRSGVHFCEECGTKVGGPPPRSVQAEPPAYAPAPAPSSPAWTPVAEPVVGVLPVLERRKGVLSTEAFTLVLTSQRLVFARLTTEMQRAVVEQAKQAAKAEGKGFLGQWGAVLGVTSALRERYSRLPVEAILGEHPDNFSIPIQEVRQVKIKSGDVEELQPDQIVIQAAEKMKFDLKGPSTRDAKQVLRQALGDRVR